MQKFKVSKDFLFKYLKDRGISTSPYDFLEKLPSSLILEGELLEGGGTVEKCCDHETLIRKMVPQCFCSCHNKKEEDKINSTPQFTFNRETPKEEVKLPEMLDINEKITPDPIVYAYKNRTKIVEILTYLASKENK